jgi:ATP/maltotriose-dependent transcriptional regulator MalT/DNA-binding SARP family transcriptional activator
VERVPEAKLLPPALPRVLVPRPRLESRLDEALTHRLTAVVAPAGFGKSTLLAEWAETNRCAWYTLTGDDDTFEQLFNGVTAALRLRVPGLQEALTETTAARQVRGPDAEAEEDRRARAHAALLALQLEDRLASDLVLVLDDLHEVRPGTASAWFVEALCRQSPTRLHLVVLSREEPPFPTARLRAQGQAVELTGSMMAFAPDETVQLITGVAGGADTSTAAALQEMTRGWPAAVRLAAESWSDRPGATGVAVGAMPEAIFAVLAEEVFALVDAEVTSFVRTVAPLDAFTVALCDALGLERAREHLDELERRGLFLVPYGGSEGWYSLHPLVRDFALARLGGGVHDDRETLLRAASWLAGDGHVRAALRCRMAAGDHAAASADLCRHGYAMVAEGGATDVIRTIDALPPRWHTPPIEQLDGEARHAVGDWDGALRCFERLGDTTESLPASAAWRSGLIHYQRGDLDAALAAYQRGMSSPPGPDRALLSAWAAAVHWLRGELDVCRQLAGEAFEMAKAHGDDRALAAAHTALAMVAALEGDRRANDAHYLRALTHAERSGDVMQLIRIRSNRGSRYLEEGHYAEALQELDGAIRLADLAGYGSFRALALSNRGQTLTRLGRLEEAMRDLASARAYYQRSGTRLLAYPLANIGDVHRARGERSLARAAYEEALELAASTGDLQGLVPALAGLARIVVDDEPERATTLAERAASSGPALDRARAMVSAGWIALQLDELGSASDWAKKATDAARAQRDRATEVEALELELMCGHDTDVTRRGLVEVASMWRALGNPLAEARTELALARLTRGVEAIAFAESALQRFRAAGARAAAAEAAGVAAALRDRPTAPVTIQVLGSFRLTRRAGPVGPAEWGSRKPRDLLKLLVARRGGPVRREAVLDILWPGEDPVKAGKKLSVALSTLRALLDPTKEFEPEHFVTADRAAVWLTLAHLEIDLERFLDAADDGLRRDARGEADSVVLLQAAETAFAGDAFEEDAYEEWAAPIREVARSTYISVVRALADHAAQNREYDVVVRLLLRVLEADSYDENAHLMMVRSLLANGRHGEAHRMYRSYCDRMDEIGIEPAPFPGNAR